MQDTSTGCGTNTLLVLKANEKKFPTYRQSDFAETKKIPQSALQESFKA